MARCEGNTCKRSLVGYSWSRLSDGSWRHNVIRECFTCRDRVASLIHYVDADVPMCSACFGQDIELEVGQERSVSRCTRCGGTDMWQLEVVESGYGHYDDDIGEDYGDDQPA